MWASLVAQTVKNLPAVQETQVWSLAQEDPLEKGMTTYFSILAWRIPWREEPGELQSIESQRVGHNWMTNTFTFNEMCWVSFVIAKFLVSYIYSELIFPDKNRKIWSKRYVHFMGDASERACFLSLSVIQHMRIWQEVSRRKLSPESVHALGLLAPRTMGNKYLLLISYHFMEFCYSLNWDISWYQEVVVLL